MSIKILFLIALAFFAGKCSHRTMPSLWQIAALAIAALGGALFYFAPMIYGAVSILITGIVAGLFAMAGSITKDAEENSRFKINFILQTLFFWPINLFDLIYLSSKMKPDNNDV